MIIFEELGEAQQYWDYQLKQERESGIQTGILKRESEIVKDLAEDGMSLEQIAKTLKIPVVFVKIYLNSD